MKTTTSFLLMVSLSVLFLVQCGKKSEIKKEPAKPPAVSVGEVHAAVPYFTQGGHTFSLYLPKTYNVQKAWPVLYFFDAHARGTLPIKRYRNIADEFGIILVGADDIKNGLNLQTIENRTDNLFEETARRFKIDKRRKYIMGFSGGARSAVMMAFLRQDVAGVIGCGAGFPSWNRPISHGFAYVAIAGKGDFNLSELRVLNERLNRSPIRHWLIEFKGSHEWPPASIVRKAITLLQIDAMRHRQIQSDPQRIGMFVKSEMRLLDSLQHANDLLSLADEYRLMINSLKGMASVKSMEMAYEKLIRSKAYLQQKEKEKRLALKEVDLQKEIRSAFDAQNIAKLKKLYRAFKRIKPQQDDYWMARRLTGLMSLLGYLYTQQALQKNDVKAAHNYLQLYALTDAQNADRFYLQAWLDLLEHNRAKAQTEAQKALKIGLDDPQKLFANPVFSVLNLH